MKKGLKNAGMDAAAATGGGMVANLALKKAPSVGSGYKSAITPAVGTAAGVYGLTKTKGLTRMALLGLTTVSAYRLVGSITNAAGLAGLGDSDSDSSGNGSIVKDLIPTASNQLNGVALGDLEEIESFDFEEGPEGGQSLVGANQGQGVGQLPPAVTAMQSENSVV